MARNASTLLILLLVVGSLTSCFTTISLASIMNTNDPNDLQIHVTNPLVFSTLTGNWSTDSVECVSIGDDGSLYIAGSIEDDQDTNDDYNCYLMKINGTDLSPIYYYSFGGSEHDFVKDMVVKADKVYIVGWTNSLDFPVANALYNTSQNMGDCFIMCLDSTTHEIIFSSYLGGSANDRGESIFVDDEGSIYVTGEADSIDFPAVNSYGNFSWPTGFVTSNTFVSKLNSSGTGLIYSSAIGGSSSETGQAIVVDSQGNAFVAGTTISNDFPTVNAYNTTAHEDLDGFHNEGFVFCLNSSGNGLIFSRYISGSNREIFSDIGLDSSNNVWVCGSTDSSDFPLVESYQDYQGETDCVLFELSANGSSLMFSTLFGGSDYESCNSLEIDSRDNVYITGGTRSAEFPRVRPINSLPRTFYDCFIMKISERKSILYATTIGGGQSDPGNSLALGQNGAVLVGGRSDSSDFPLRNEISGPSLSTPTWSDGFALILLDISDEDGDNFPSWWELVNGYDPLNANAPVIEILTWYAPVLLVGVSTTFLLLILIFGRYKIRRWIRLRLDIHSKDDPI